MFSQNSLQDLADFFRFLEAEESCLTTEFWSQNNELGVGDSWVITVERDAGWCVRMVIHQQVLGLRRAY